MLSGLTTLLFGSSSSSSASSSSSQSQDNNNPHLKIKCQRKLKTKEDEDGWVIVTDNKKQKLKKSIEPLEATNVVVVNNNNVADDSEEDWETNLSTSIDSTPDEASAEPSSPLPTPSTPSSLTQLDPDGSWYLTPPPCFTAGSAASSTFVSPMENLLIEHPSMSVYQWDEPSNDDDDVEVAVDETPSSTEKMDEEPVVARSKTVRIQQTDVKKSEVTTRRRERTHRASSSSSINSSRAGLFFAQILSNETDDKRLQLKHQMQHGSKSYCRNQLDRGNKVREFNGIGKKMRRKDRMKNPSGMNNNRRC